MKSVCLNVALTMCHLSEDALGKANYCIYFIAVKNILGEQKRRRKGNANSFKDCNYPSTTYYF